VWASQRACGRCDASEGYRGCVGFSAQVAARSNTASMSRNDNCGRQQSFCDWCQPTIWRRCFRCGVRVCALRIVAGTLMRKILDILLRSVHIGIAADVLTCRTARQPSAAHARNQIVLEGRAASRPLAHTSRATTERGPPDRLKTCARSFENMRAKRAQVIP